jgi:hypothetical protein
MQAISENPQNDQNEDAISWRWTDNGEYTTKSAYRIQFLGDSNKLNISPLWKARAESKCRFFAWTLMLGKILTADNLQKKGWQNDPICKLCNNEH